jgi:hypothetical protein
VKGPLRAVLFAAFTAALGFTFALATMETASRGSGMQPAATSRSVGETLKINNPFFVSQGSADAGLAGDPLFPLGGNQSSGNGYDLGDIEVQKPFKRYISATGGFLPYTYGIEPLLGSDNVGGPVIPPIVPDIDRAGVLSGLVPNFAGSLLRYTISVTDFIGTEVDGLFKLNLIPQNQAFRFAISQLPRAEQAHTYYTNFDTIGNTGAVEYKVVPETLRVGTLAVASLETLGLSLSPDGILYGRPLISGTVTFTVAAFDAGLSADDRTGTVKGQAVSVQIAQNAVASTELAAQSCQVRGSVSATGEDSFSYTGLLDAKGDIAASLAGSPFVVRINGAAFSGTFDDKGRVQGESAGGQLKASFSPKTGRLQIKLKNIDLATALQAGSLQNKTMQNLVLVVEVGALRTTEVLSTDVRVGGGRFQMNYALGRQGIASTGAFQVISATGQDAKLDGEPGDRWLVRFLAVPRGIDGKPASDVVSAGGSVTMRIGFTYQQAVSVALKSVRLEFKATGDDVGIFRLLLDPKKFVHRLETNILTESQTGIPAAFDALDPLGVFPLGMDFTGFKGETGKIIAPNRSRWIHR